MNGLVDFRLKDGVARITMDDGKLNVMSLAMLTALHEAFDQAAEAGAIAVLRGREGVFSAGFDLKVFAAGDIEGSQAMVRSGAELALKLLTFETPVLSLCTGHAFPMGAFLLLGSDARIGVGGSYRIGLNEVAIGIPVPSFGIEMARQRLQPAYLSRTVATGEMFGPDEACRAGFLDRVVPAAELDDVAEAAITALKQIHLPSHAIAKARLRQTAAATIRSVIDGEITLQAYQDSARGRSSVRLPGAAA